MTEFGLMKTMTISYFKAHISEQLRRVRKGARIVISDRDTPIAEVVPYKPQASSLVIRAPLVTPFKAPRASFRRGRGGACTLKTQRRPAAVRSCGARPAAPSVMLAANGKAL